MKSKRSYVVAVLLAALALGPSAVAQDDPAPTPPAEPPATPTKPVTPDAAGAPPGDTAAPVKKEPAPFALYVEAGYGSASAKELNLSMSTLSTHAAESTLVLDDNTYSRAAVGWRLDDNRGDFRLVFNGYSEKGYTLESTGFAAQVQVPAGTSQPGFQDQLPWWELSIENGTLTSIRTPRTWTPGVDVNGNGMIDENEPANSDANRNGFVDLGEETVLPPNLEIVRPISDNLENRAQNWDLLYGNSWGPRRFRGRWWAGLRYFQYEGNALAGAWLSTFKTGYGFTDGEFLHVLNFSQKTTGGGPTGSLEAQFRFFRERLSLFAMGQAAFVLLSYETDTGPFFTIVEDDTGADLSVPARLNETLDKSTWQTGIEGGVRYRFDNGLELELAYNVTGYLDAVLAPTSIRIPETSSEARFGTSAIYRTQDYVLDAWRAGISFQF